MTKVENESLHAKELLSYRIKKKRKKEIQENLLKFRQ